MRELGRCFSRLWLDGADVQEDRGDAGVGGDRLGPRHLFVSLDHLGAKVWTETPRRPQLRQSRHK
jgi:hypothetical protein